VLPGPPSGAPGGNRSPYAFSLICLATIKLRRVSSRSSRQYRVFIDHHRGDHGLGRQAAGDKSLGGRHLNDGPFAGPACIFRPVGHKPAVLNGDHVEPARGVLADRVKRVMCPFSGSRNWGRGEATVSLFWGHGVFTGSRIWGRGGSGGGAGAGVSGSEPVRKDRRKPSGSALGSSKT